VRSAQGSIFSKRKAVSEGVALGVEEVEAPSSSTTTGPAGVST
jgi:hypothetical protein